MKLLGYALAAAVVGSSVLAMSNSETVVLVGLQPGAEVDLDAERESFRRDLEIDYPEDNMPNAARIALGKTLFFDPRLSRSGGQSCASCHNPAFAWGDGLPVGVGDHLRPLERRSPSILNLAWAEPLMWDGRAESLEDQALGPMVAKAEMNISLEKLITRLESIPGYASMFAEAFDGDATITPDRVAKSLAAFQRTVISGMAPFDEWVEGDEAAITAQAVRGFELFVGEANCATCHEGWRFTDDAFYDIGLADDDLGRGNIVPNIEVLNYAFKTPGLRNITQRGPYMHDGRLATLRDVIEHYNDGGVARP
nr:cytochrome c peroxidase [Paracoccaceae bacterium]